MRAFAARSACLQLDRADRPVDGYAGVPSLRQTTLQNDIGVADLVRLAEQPIAHRQRLAQPLVGQR